MFRPAFGFAQHPRTQKLVKIRNSWQPQNYLFAFITVSLTIWLRLRKVLSKVGCKNLVISKVYVAFVTRLYY